MNQDSVFIFISPHLDDVILSCSGYINQLVQQNYKVLIATVVTADDTSKLPPSWLAQRNLRAWGSQENIFALRCEEDKKAAAALGAEVVHLGFLDCIFRRDANQAPLYAKNVVNVPVHPQDWVSFEPALQTALKSLFNQYSGQDVHVVCPLAIGGHVDHVIIRHAVEAVIDSAGLIYYEDFPYAQQIESYQKNLERLCPNVVQLSEDDKILRVKAATFYTSQILGLFPSCLDILLEIARARLPYIGKRIPVWHHTTSVVHRMEKSLSKYSAITGGERYWTRSGSADLLGSFGTS